MPNSQDYRSRMEICKLLFQLLAKNSLTPNQVREKLHLSSKGVTEYLDLIQFIQSQPPLQIAIAGKFRLVSLRSDDNLKINDNSNSLATIPTSNYHSNFSKAEVSESTPKKAKSIPHQDTLSPHKNQEPHQPLQSLEDQFVENILDSYSSGIQKQWSPIIRTYYQKYSKSLISFKSINIDNLEQDLILAIYNSLNVTEKKKALAHEIAEAMIDAFTALENDDESGSN